MRSYQFARRWVAAGHEVVVLTGVGYDPSIQGGARQVIDGIEVRAVGTRYAPGMGFARRIFAFLGFALSASWHAVMMPRFDVVLATSTPLTVAIPGMLAKWLRGTRLVFEVRDVWPDAAVDIGQLKNAWLIHCATWLERLAYRSADHIVPLSTGMQQRIERKGVKAAKMTMIPNCADLELFASGSRRIWRERFDAGEKFIILYAGAISAANHVEILADIIDHLQHDSGWEWWFVGEGNRHRWLQSQATARSWTNVRFLGIRPKQELPDIAAADCGVISFVPHPVYYENSPNKFFDYIAASLPVVFTRTTWLEDFVGRYDCGFVARSGSAAESVSHLRKLLLERDRSREMGRRARRLAEECFSRDALAALYLRLLEDVKSRKTMGAVDPDEPAQASHCSHGV